MNIGIIGNGFVGKATRQLQCAEINILCYDIVPSMCHPIGTTLKDLVEQCNVIFVSVPTPMDKNGECHLKILESVVSDIKKMEYKGFIVVRSTIPVGTCRRLECYFMPEFLTETNYINDFIENENWIFGLLENDSDERKYKFQETMRNIFQTAHRHHCIHNDTIHFVTTDEAEMIKLFRNCFLATKVSFCNEIHEFCSLKNVNYENVRELATLDKRITSSHSKVPGKDGHFGFGGTCFPKDISNLNHEMKKVGMQSFILSSVIDRNENKDRREKDWLEDKGRASV